MPSTAAPTINIIMLKINVKTYIGIFKKCVAINESPVPPPMASRLGSTKNATANANIVLPINTDIISFTLKCTFHISFTESQIPSVLFYPEGIIYYLICQLIIYYRFIKKLYRQLHYKTRPVFLYTSLSTVCYRRSNG